MKSHLLVASLLALSALPLAQASDVEVTFSLTLGHPAAPSLKACAVSVPAGADGGDVLDAATAAGCISGWEFGTFGTSRFVTCIDGICQQLGTFWAFYLDEAMPEGGDAGIDDWRAAGGEDVEFVYRDWFTPFPPFSL